MTGAYGSVSPQQPSAAQQAQHAQRTQRAHQGQRTQHAQQPEEAQHAQQQPAIQPVLALLTSGLPPIVLGTFSGDMQRARIILEAAGFLTPFDISSSLLPLGLQSGLPQQLPAVPALHAEHAEHAGPAGAQQESTQSEEEDEEAAVQQALDLSQAVSSRACVPGRAQMRCSAHCNKRL